MSVPRSDRERHTRVMTARAAEDGNPDILGALRDAGYRMTAARRAVIAALDGIGDHFTPEDVLRRGRAIHPRLGRATVYRTLEVCAGLGLVRPMYSGAAGLQYVVAEGGHHHVVCCSCGLRAEFEECALGEMERDVAVRYGFEIRGHLLELYGVCAGCRDRGDDRGDLTTPTTPTTPTTTKKSGSHDSSADRGGRDRR